METSETALVTEGGTTQTLPQTGEAQSSKAGGNLLLEDYGRATALKAWKRVKSAWGAISLIALLRWFHWIWDKTGDVDLAHTVLGWFGGDFGMIITFIQGPVFAGIMAVVGILGLVFFEAPKMRTKYPFLPAAGIILLVIFSSLIFGSATFEQLLKTPKFSEVTQYYIDGHTIRRLKRDQIITLTKAFCGLEFRNIPFSIGSIDTAEANQYAEDFMAIFRSCKLNAFGTRAGTQIFPMETRSFTTDSHGIVVGVRDLSAPNFEAKMFMSALMDAGIKSKLDTDQGFIGRFNLIIEEN